MRTKDLPGEQVVRRRGNLEQGRALETLGHAVEYLVDSRMFLEGKSDGLDDREAVQTLMRLSRAVFLECAEVVPMRRKLARWVSGSLGRVRRQAV